MKSIILHQSIVTRDAIGNDISNMCQVLNCIGHETYVYGDILNINTVQLADRKQLKSIIAEKDNLIIYHHSQYWKSGEEILSEAKAKIIFKYHNITPEHFFTGYNQKAVNECRIGREMTERLILHHTEAYWTADSAYNLQDIEAVRPDRKMVIPPFTNIEKWNSIMPDAAILKRLLESRDINILFIGRVVPNKGHKFILEVLRDYIIHYGRRIRLHLIGKIDQKSKYTRELAEAISQLGLAKHFHFAGEVNERAVLAYYLGSDIYLSGSEHEGFCVPIVEAQFCHLPVVARNTSAVAETLGADQILLSEDISEYSSAIRLICTTTAYRDVLVDAGYNNYHTRFTNSIIAERFKDVVSQATGVHI
jgi:glycosyltransferase involved in cell wall biosynthesis